MAAIIPQSRRFYHGTSATFDVLQPNTYGIVWLGDKDTARAYAQQDEQLQSVNHPDRKARLIELSLAADSRIIDLRDTRDPLTRTFWTKKSTWPVEQWAVKATHTILENNWAVPYLRELGVDAAIVSDSLGFAKPRHDSVAVLNPGIIVAMKTVPTHRRGTIWEQHHPNWNSLQRGSVPQKVKPGFD